MTAAQEAPHAGNPLRGLRDQNFDGTGLHIGIISARWNPEICGALTDGAKRVMEAAGAKVTIEYVAGMEDFL